MPRIASMVRSFTRALLPLSLCPILLLASIAPAFANGAVFEQGSESGTPLPSKQHELYLKKEHVVFRDNEVVARFWVQNPSAQDISVKMGFPLNHGYRSGPIRDDDKIAFLSRITSRVSITSGGKPFKLEMNEQEKGPYRVTFLWDMTYPAGKLTEFTVHYPMDRTWGSADGLGENSAFVYITHTGASWARPIEEALFEYYDRDFVNFVTSYFPGLWWENEQTQLDVRHVISPQPYTLDLEEGKIVWERSNWVPRTVKDDIRVSLDWKYRVGAPGVDTHTSDPSSFELLCGMQNETADLEKIAHFGEAIRIDAVKYDKTAFERTIYHEAGKYQERSGKYPAIAAHLELAGKLEVLKYLRNYLSARHGHVFKNDELSGCYRDVKVKKSWSPAEKENLALIQELEKPLTREYREAFRQIKDEMLDMDLLAKALFAWKYREAETAEPSRAEKKRASP